MGDNLPAIWERAAHTFAKHQILQAYLNAWIPIMSRQSHRLGATESLLFVDGFAGPGCYLGGQDGSPILAIKSVIDHVQPLPIPISFLFIEEDPERCEVLRGTIRKHEHDVQNSPRIRSVRIEQGDCESAVNAFLDSREEASLPVGPALFFLDQFGYGDVSMDLIKRIMSCRQCEVFSYLNWDHMHRFLADQSKWASLNMTFGGEEWKPALGLELRDRSGFVLQAYRRALRAKGGSRYVWPFTMSDEADNPLYWLFFCTNSLRGLEEMKKAMWRVDPSGGFRFSDRDDPAQIHLFSEYTESSLASELSVRFAGRTVRVREIEEFVLAETPACTFKTCLRGMERNGQIRPVNAPPSRRKGTFKDENMRVAFTEAS